MKIRIWSNEIEANLTPFIGRYIGNVCLAIVASLKTSESAVTLRYDVSGESVRITLNDKPLSLNLNSGFAEKMILDTIRGMIRLLKMADPSGVIRIEIDTELPGSDNKPA
ncbi:MAG: hypothetical protein FWF13_00420 [Acidobacteria bacterium]|nr:hypothetical protein [Acidobacteriota bacterium]